MSKQEIPAENLGSKVAELRQKSAEKIVSMLEMSDTQEVKMTKVLMSDHDRSLSFTTPDGTVWSFKGKKFPEKITQEEIAAKYRVAVQEKQFKINDYGQILITLTEVGDFILSFRPSSSKEAGEIFTMQASISEQLREIIKKNKDIHSLRAKAKKIELAAVQLQKESGRQTASLIAEIRGLEGFLLLNQTKK